MQTVTQNIWNTVCILLCRRHAIINVWLNYASLLKDVIFKDGIYFLYMIKLSVVKSLMVFQMKIISCTDNFIVI